MRIAYITDYDATNIRNWSGTGYYIQKSIFEKGADIQCIGNLKIKRYLYQKIKEKGYKYLLNKKYFIDRNPYVIKDFAQQISKRLPVNTDVLVGPSSIPFAKMKSNIPIVFWTDAVFKNMVDFYPEFSNLCKESIIDGHEMEKASLENATIAVYSSDWAAESAVKYYDISPEKIKVVPYGANLDHNSTLETIKARIHAKSRSECNLLFIGVHWIRKGGDKAIEITKYLNENGLKTELSVVGTLPENINSAPDFVKYYGFISKETDAGKKLLTDLISKAHFLILPTIADCTPIVFSEFNSYGIPVITTNVGGIPSVVKDNVNGKKFSLDSTPELYGNYIISMIENHKMYTHFALSAYDYFLKELNWDVSIDKFLKILKEL